MCLQTLAIQAWRKQAGQSHVTAVNAANRSWLCCQPLDPTCHISMSGLRGQHANQHSCNHAYISLHTACYAPALSALSSCRAACLLT
jgi:hypothetical protein